MDDVDLFRTSDIALLMVIKSLLESAGIPFSVQGEEGLHVLPLSFPGAWFDPSAYGAVIRVRKEDLADARKIIEDTVALPDDENQEESGG